MNKEIKYLLKDLCVEWGFCIPSVDAEKIANMQKLEADEFACLVLEAEGMKPEYEKQWRRKIRDIFIEKFGDEVSSQQNS